MKHKCNESEGKIPMIKVNEDNSYNCQFCNEKLKFEDVFLEW